MFKTTYLSFIGHFDIIKFSIWINLLLYIVKCIQNNIFDVMFGMQGMTDSHSSISCNKPMKKSAFRLLLF